MAKISVIIPSRNCNYLAKTVEDIFAKTKGDIEIIALLDDFWPVPLPKDDPRLIIVHKGSVGGMRDSINRGVGICHGKYIMKTDDHCAFGEGFDEILQKNCGDDELMVCSRYSLDAEKWEKRDKPPVQYNYLTFPYIKDEQFGFGFHGKKWTDGNLGMTAYYGPENRSKDKPIDEVITFQGSCWFMSKQKFLDIDMLDTKRSYLMFQEAQELGFKVWLSGGRVLVNKGTWYAHYHKNNGDSGYGLSKQAKYDTERMSTWYWMNDKWSKATRKIEWLIDKFMPMPGWDQDWRSKIGGNVDTNFRIFDENGHDGLTWQT